MDMRIVRANRIEHAADGRLRAFVGEVDGPEGVLGLCLMETGGRGIGCEISGGVLRPITAEGEDAIRVRVKMEQPPPASSSRFRCTWEDGSTAALQIDGPEKYEVRASTRYPAHQRRRWHIHGRVTCPTRPDDEIDAYYVWGRAGSPVYIPAEAGLPCQPYFTGWAPLWSDDPARDMIRWQVGGNAEITEA